MKNEPQHTRTQLTARQILKAMAFKVNINSQTIMYIQIGNTRFDIPMDTVFTISSKNYDKKDK